MSQSIQPEKPRLPLKLAVLISGSGRTLANLADLAAAGHLPAQVGLVISSRADAGGIRLAADRSLPIQVIARKSFVDTGGFSAAVWQSIRQAGCGLVLLAGFLSKLEIPEDRLGTVMNIHPALLPKFGGQGMWGHHVHEAVLAAGEPESGCTVHFADNQYDRGPIILQRRCPVLPGDTPDALAARVFEQECLAYPEAIRMYASGELAALAAKCRGGVGRRGE